MKPCRIHGERSRSASGRAVCYLCERLRSQARESKRQAEAAATRCALCGFLDQTNVRIDDVPLCKSCARRARRLWRVILQELMTTLNYDASVKMERS